MRPIPEASLAPWPTRILRPWLVASAAGLSIGTVLLSLNKPEAENSYSEPAPRAAVYDAPRADTTPDPFAPVEKLSLPANLPQLDKSSPAISAGAPPAGITAQ